MAINSMAAFIQTSDMTDAARYLFTSGMLLNALEIA